jgi:hypothetical protein
VKVSLARYTLAAIPALMLVLAPLFANRVEPRVFGFPFILAWLLVWVLGAPLFLLAAERLRSKT